MAVITTPESIPDITTMAGLFLAARAALDMNPDFDTTDPLAAFRAMPGDHHADTVVGPDDENRLHYILVDGSSLIHDGWGYRFLAPCDAPGQTRAETALRLSDPQLRHVILDVATAALVQHTQLDE